MKMKHIKNIKIKLDLFFHIFMEKLTTIKFFSSIETH